MQLLKKPPFTWILAGYDRYAKANIATEAAALAFHSLLSIVPVVGLVLWYLTRLGVTGYWMDEAKKFLLAQVNVSSSETFLQYFEQFTSLIAGDSMGWWSVLLLLYTSWNLMDRLSTSLDNIVQEKKAPLRWKKYFVILGVRFLVMLGLPIVVLLTLAASQWIRKDSWLHYVFDLKTVGPFIALPVAWLANVVSFSLIYKFVPAIYIPYKQALKAAAIVVPVLEVSRRIMGWYNGYAVSVHQVYGVLAVIPIFILWVQIFWMVILCGALFIKLPRTKLARK